MNKPTNDFRQSFKSMAPQAIISRAELATLLSTSSSAISQMAYRGELPKTAFPSKRRACWFVSDIRDWLDKLANSRLTESQNPTNKIPAKSGRPRLSTSNSL
jgi:predicted DNA-binding transcriptional regulator AlpA